MRRIRLTKGKWATVDDRFYAKLVAMGSWCWGDDGYARRGIRVNGRCKTILMHREVLRLAGVRVPALVDHENGRRRDNRLRNLRPASYSQNNHSRRGSVRNVTGYIGVYKKGRSSWSAMIRCDGIRHYLGTFKSKITAARAYDSGSRAFFGKFAITNFA